MLESLKGIAIGIKLNNLIVMSEPSTFSNYIYITSNNLRTVTFSTGKLNKRQTIKQTVNWTK